MIVKKRPDGMMSFTATYGQSIYDLIDMTYGDYRMVYKLMKDSGIVNLNESNLSGREIIFNPDLVTDKQFYNALSQNAVVINTLDPDDTLSGKAFNKSFNLSFR